MPDGDIVHGSLRRLYQDPYQQLCEQKDSSDKCAGYVIKALRKDLKRKGNLPVRLAKSMGEKIEQVINAASNNNSVDWIALNNNLDTLARQENGRSDLKELTLRAAKGFVHDLRYKREISAENASENILKRYMQEVYKSEFKERIPKTSKHYAGIDEVTLKRRIDEIQPYVDAATSKWAKQANIDESVDHLKYTSRYKVNKEKNYLAQGDLLSADKHEHQKKIEKLLIAPLQITTSELKQHLSSSR